MGCIKTKLDTAPGYFRKRGKPGFGSAELQIDIGKPLQWNLCDVIEHSGIHDMELSVKDKGENARTIADGNIVGIGGRGQ